MSKILSARLNDANHNGKIDEGETITYSKVLQIKGRRIIVTETADQADFFKSGFTNDVSPLDRLRAVSLPLGDRPLITPHRDPMANLFRKTSAKVAANVKKQQEYWDLKRTEEYKELDNLAKRIKKGNEKCDDAVDPKKGMMDSKTPSDDCKKYKEKLAEFKKRDEPKDSSMRPILPMWKFQSSQAILMQQMIQTQEAMERELSQRLEKRGR